VERSTIIRICKLEKDLEVMVAGDGSFIDESTENECFKAKINIARCLYRRADIYVFDDPFGMISFETAQFIFDKAIKILLKVRSMFLLSRLLTFHNSDLSKLQNKMCIVASKHRKLLHEIDDVISMKNGSVCCETRTRSSKDEMKLNFPSMTVEKVSLTAIFHKFVEQL
jgi:ABC-type Mn2+/Zn2+ transport system ATPase subunit